tara:strand:+ start:7441 stop:7584 length:144 start_codon:yes stop_codon:yes gene_type:complete
MMSVSGARLEALIEKLFALAEFASGVPRSKPLTLIGFLPRPKEACHV